MIRGDSRIDVTVAIWPTPFLPIARAGALQSPQRAGLAGDPDQES
jgi:hypothetical protein